MAKRRRSAAQIAATRKLVALNRHKNPARKRRRNPGNPYAVTTVRAARHPWHKVARHRNPIRRHHNPSLFKGGVLGELLSLEGAMMVGAAFAAPITADFIQETVMPSASGWIKIGLKAGIIGAGTWAISRFLKKNRVAVAFGVTGAAVLVSDAIHLVRGQVSGLNDAQSDYLSTRPELMDAILSGDLDSGFSHVQHHSEELPQLGMNTSLGGYDEQLAGYSAGLAGIANHPGQTDPVEAWSPTF